MASPAGQASGRHGAEAFRPQDMRRPGTGGTEEQHRLADIQKVDERTVAKRTAQSRTTS